MVIVLHGHESIDDVSPDGGVLHEFNLFSYWLWTAIIGYPYFFLLSWCKLCGIIHYISTLAASEQLHPSPCTGQQVSGLQKLLVEFSGELSRNWWFHPFFHVVHRLLKLSPWPVGEAYSKNKTNQAATQLLSYSTTPEHVRSGSPMIPMYPQRRNTIHTGGNLKPALWQFISQLPWQASWNVCVHCPRVYRL